MYRHTDNATPKVGQHPARRDPQQDHFGALAAAIRSKEHSGDRVLGPAFRALQERTRGVEVLVDLLDLNRSVHHP